MTDLLVVDQPLPDLAADVVPGSDATPVKRKRGRPARPAPAAKATKAAQDKSIIPPPAAKPQGRPTKNDAELRKAAASFLGWVGAGLALASPIDAAVLEVRSERLAGRLAEVAATNEALARFLTAAGTGGGWAGLATELATVGVAVAANHGALSPTIATMVMPEYLHVLQAERQRQADDVAEAQRRAAARRGSAAL